VGGPAAICDVTPVDPSTWFGILFNGGDFQGNPWSLGGGRNIDDYNAMLGCAQATQTPPAERPPWMPPGPAVGACLSECSPPSSESCLTCFFDTCGAEIDTCFVESCSEDS
jgi:hypothetical protein